MLKKILTISAIFAATFSTCFADGRLYVAPEIAYEDVRSKENIHYQAIIPMLALGYGGMFYPWLYLAAEIFGIYHSIDLNNEPKHGYSLKTEYSYGGSVLFGYPLDDDLVPYLRLGLVSTHFDKLDVTKSAYEIGLGVETPFTCNWYGRAEYDFNRYRDIHPIGEPEISYFVLGVVYRFG